MEAQKSMKENNIRRSQWFKKEGEGGDENLKHEDSKKIIAIANQQEAILLSTISWFRK